MSYQQLIANLGIGYAHPGGSDTTKKWTEELDISAFSHILEVGCGIGETAKQLTRLTNAPITAIDHDEQMIHMAKTNTHHYPQIMIKQADVHQLPYADQSFDFIIAESVLSFTNTSQSMKELARLIIPQGTMVFVEMTASDTLTDADKQLIEDFYDIPSLHTYEEWASIFRQHDCTIQHFEYLDKQLKGEWLQKNENFQWDEDAFETLRTHQIINATYHDQLAAGLYVVKPSEGAT
ncbi:type 11 methyltransferase [Gracilibacillus halophilus YIM-C55.5]|uniref:Type 11 methyltransferase n=1 Tax=Gracilibacillus halophilus YIM-C55.5 TaxID=1308866 RepID=N4WD24_9BACI|nr:class I SAM-dependent methyltransferase [Gracilibacillus halophilus]ENH98188.1 type 11 methyltransferase [Gracilibacillus halophilus YIM-C55.5]